jgi:hypothetical protein
MEDLGDTELSFLNTLYALRTNCGLQKSIIALVALGVFLNCCISLSSSFLNHGAFGLPRSISAYAQKISGAPYNT